MGSNYQLGPFRLDTAGELSRDGVTLPLGQRGAAILTMLVEHAPEYVQKSDIFETAWPDMVVVDNNLSVQISVIRRILAQAPGGEGWIETLARRGYRYTGPLTRMEAAAPRSSAPDPRRTNLPRPLTSFIGRASALAELRKLLTTTRLLTLTGIGGIGKTRLAQHLATGVLDNYRDGVWFIDLAPLSDPAHVASAVAQVLGVRESPSAPLQEILCRQVTGRQMLLILDNCEHVLGACATLAEALLRAAAEPVILATSREPLHVGGEFTYPLATLSLPDADANEEEMAQAESVQLFIGRAQQHLPGSLIAQRVHTVAQLCIQLDGIPLALELAAARVRSLTVEQIISGLEDRFRLLSGGSRTALPRQQTLRAMLDWSFDMLAEEERAVLRRLAVFHGGFSLEAAAQVASDTKIDAASVAQILAQLVSRSLVVADVATEAARYHLLETPRAYAIEKLDEAGETAGLVRCHAQYYRDYFAQAPEDWLRLSDAAWRSTYTIDYENARAALEWALSASGDIAIGVALASAAGPMWLDLALFGLGGRYFDNAIARIAPGTPDREQAQLWLWRGILVNEKTPLAAVTAKTRAVALYRKLGDTPGLGLALTLTALALILVGRNDEAAENLEEAFPLLVNANLPKALARHWEVSAFRSVHIVNLAAARTQFDCALTLYRDAGAARDTFRVLGNASCVVWSVGDLDAAIAGFRKAEALMRNSAVPIRATLAFLLTNLAGALTERGDFDAALAAAREGLPSLAESGHAWINMDHYALRAALTGQLTNAALLAGYADAAHILKGKQREPTEARAHERLHALLREKVAADELDRLFAAGGELSDMEACKLALG